MKLEMLGMMYMVVAIIVFVLVLVFFWWVGRAEEKECELYPEDFYKKETAGEYTLPFVAIIIGIIAAIMWAALPLILLFVWIHEQLAKKFPSAMGNLAEYTEERKGSENE